MMARSRSENKDSQMKTSLMQKLIFAFFVAGSALSTAHAGTGGSFERRWTTIADGGGSCSGGACAVSATIGQPETAVAAGGSFSLASGFWQGMTETFPSLRIEPYDGFVLLAWPALSAGFRLQENSDLGNRNWTEVT